MLQGFELIDWRNKDEVIKFYESNKLYFDNYQSQNQIETILSTIDIKLSYCDAQISKYHYSDCLEILTHVNILINKLENKNSEEFESRNERYLFTEGVVLGYLKRNEESQNNFKELLKIDPRNDLYKDWYNDNKIKIISKQSNIVGFTGFGIIMLVIFANTIFKSKLSSYYNLAGFLIMTIGFFFPYIFKFFKK